MEVGVAYPSGIEPKEDFIWSCYPLISGGLEDRERSNIPGSGTGTSSTAVVKSGPAFITTPALQVLGITGSLPSVVASLFVVSPVSVMFAYDIFPNLKNCL